MIIANPIYDVVFKYLLEDTEIARELLSTILGEEIVSIELKPQESTTESAASSVSIFRVDFKAVVKYSSGETKKILIELQKAKQLLDAMRFRRYLVDNYRKEDEYMNQNELEKRPLPIVTIYFLGFELDNIPNAAVKVNREYRDANTNELILVKEDFVELLTHDSYFIQIPRLKAQTKTKLEQVLQVFSPEFKTQDSRQLDFKGDTQYPLVQKMLNRLTRAIASDEIRDKMDFEDEIERVFGREIKKVNIEKDKIIAEKEKELTIERQKVEALLLQLAELEQKIKSN
jgi:hypothetical protein